MNWTRHTSQPWNLHAVNATGATCSRPTLRPATMVPFAMNATPRLR
jgi:hypothetical protein